MAPLRPRENTRGASRMTRHKTSVGGLPIYWVRLTKLVSRIPKTDGFLVVQDDVVFMKGTCDFLRMLNPPTDAGVLSLFCPACDNGPFGWHQTEASFGRAGAQAIFFPGRRAFEFLAHPWTVNYRRIKMQPNEHFRTDGLHHIDGVIGEWCHRAGLEVYPKSSSLSQHIDRNFVICPDSEASKIAASSAAFSDQGRTQCRGRFVLPGPKSRPPFTAMIRRWPFAPISNFSQTRCLILYSVL